MGFHFPRTHLKTQGFADVTLCISAGLAILQEQQKKEMLFLSDMKTQATALALTAVREGAKGLVDNGAHILIN